MQPLTTGQPTLALISHSIGAHKGWVTQLADSKRFSKRFPLYLLRFKAMHQYVQKSINWRKIKIWGQMYPLKNYEAPSIKWVGQPDRKKWVFLSTTFLIWFCKTPSLSPKHTLPSPFHTCIPRSLTQILSYFAGVSESYWNGLNFQWAPPFHARSR